MSFVPSTFVIKCGCGKHVTIRTAEAIMVQSCWNCASRQIKVVMGHGRNNYRCYVVEGKKEIRVTPIHADQGGRA